jgi:hypothetical protein
METLREGNKTDTRVLWNLRVVKIVVIVGELAKEVIETLAVKNPQSNPNNTGLTLKYPVGRGKGEKTCKAVMTGGGIAGGGLQSDGAQT